MTLRIRQERLKNNWTQEYVAKQVGLKKVSIQQIETAQRKPSYDVLVKLENLFGEPHRKLFAAVEEEHKNT